MESDRDCSPRKFSYEDLSRFTDDFSNENFIGETMFGRLYRGYISDEQDGMKVPVTVKIWFDRRLYEAKPEDKTFRVKEEVSLLEHYKFEYDPNLPRLIGHCSEGTEVGVVYDINPLNTVFKLLLDDGFTWMQRIKVAVQFARFIDFLHSEKHNSNSRFIVRNIGPTHILLDQECCPKYVDFGMLSGGLFPDRRDFEAERQFGSFGYNDPLFSFPGTWSQKCDVFGFGCLLISLFCKEVFVEREELFRSSEFPFSDLSCWARENFSPKYNMYTEKFPESHCSLVHESFKGATGFYDSDAMKLTKIIIQCIHECKEYRPSMEEVFESLLQLLVVKEFADELSLEHMISRRLRSRVVQKKSGHEGSKKRIKASSRSPIASPERRSSGKDAFLGRCYKDLYGEAEYNRLINL